MNTKSATQPERKAKSFEMKTANAQKAGVNDLEKQLYLQKYASLGKVKEKAWRPVRFGRGPLSSRACSY
jgi:hypothetical protein|tara:strand:+ start:352 stop:558 length:207 start_codon:yes stop_codon:yes gene_type:complete